MQITITDAEYQELMRVRERVNANINCIRKRLDMEDVDERNIVILNMITRLLEELLE